MEHNSVGTPPAGSIRFNTDSSKMEIYNGEKWWEIDSTSPTEQTGGTRGLMMGGKNPSTQDTIDYITIATLGNAADFGDTTGAASKVAAVSNSVRAVMGGGGNTDMSYVTIATTGNATDYGDLTTARATLGACSDSHGGIV